MATEWKRRQLIRTHLDMREHLYRIINGLTQELLLKEISDEEQYPHLLSVIWHIGGAETYWFHRARHDIAPRFSIERYEEIWEKLQNNTEGIKRVVNECNDEQLQITPPSDSNDPSVAWCVLRTYQHGLYHSGQISKIRHMIGAPPISYEKDTWSPAVDSIIEIIRTIWNQG